MKIQPGLKTIRLLGVRKKPDSSTGGKGDEIEVPHFSRIMSPPNVLEESKIEESEFRENIKMLRTEIFE
jgi:hypothetical protein